MLRLFGENTSPLIMDEALCQLDNTRVAHVLSLLEKLCVDIEQIIIFTCHTRELEICKEKGIKSNNILL